MLAALARPIAALWLSFFFRIEVHGLENLPSKGAVIAAKHRRWEDIPLLAVALPLDLHYLAKAELFVGSVKKRIIRGLGGIPIDRQRPMLSRDSLRHVGDLLSAGKSLVVFPEGTYFRYSMGKGKEGALRFLVSRFDNPVVPVGIEYTKGLIRGKAIVRIGVPLVKSSESKDFHEAIMAEMANLSGFST